MSTQRSTHSKRVWVLGVVLGILFLWISTTVISAISLKHAFQNAQIAAVARHSRYLRLTSSTLSILTFRSSATIESVDAALAIAAQAQNASQAVAQVQAAASTQSVDLKNLLHLIVSLEKETTRLEKNLPHCQLCTHYLPEPVQNNEAAFIPYIKAIQTLSAHLLTGTHRYMVLFQNSDELRATGGFMGSYAIVTVIDGVLQPLIIEDIYDADGQFTGKIPAPNGVAQYLSSDNGLRLPDANWAPHFPTSAKQILQFFALGERENFEGVIALNDAYFSDLLSLIGPVWLPDYQITVTPENITTALRIHREDFFAGSIQKKHLLSQFQNQILIALAQHSISPADLAQLTLQHIQQKNILAYSSEETIQNTFIQLGIDGSLFTLQADNALAFVESNVGINKANKHVSRKLSLSSTNNKLTAHYLITNDNLPPHTTQLKDLVEEQNRVKTAKNQAPHLAYVNYQRVIYPHSWQLLSVDIDGQNQTETHTTTHMLSATNAYSETGFLVVTPEQQQTLVTLTFQTNQPLVGTTLEIFKQPGTQSLPIWLENPKTTPFSTQPALILEKNNEFNVTITP